MVNLFFYVALNSILLGNKIIGTIELHNYTALQQSERELVVGADKNKKNSNIENDTLEEIVCLELHEDDREILSNDYQEVQSKSSEDFYKYVVCISGGAFCLTLILFVVVVCYAIKIYDS